MLRRILCASACTGAALALIPASSAFACYKPVPRTTRVVHTAAQPAAPLARPAPPVAARPTPAPAPVRTAPAQAPATAPVVTTSATGSTSAIQAAFGPMGPGAVAWANRVSACESGGSATAQNPSGATGLFQIMPSTYASTPQGQSGASITDPNANAQAAAFLYSQGRQGEWSCN